MVPIHLSIVVREDRHLVVDLPPEVPVGPAELLILPQETITERDQLRERLIAMGLLVRPEDMGIPDDLEYVSDEELEELGKLPPGAPTALEIINEDRGKY